ncbi:hypothetical protein L227DRAFT_617874 [Lentinus tigrinus ALCF2SS1-6]|uniref:Uncharacterized protein n=1 Tax=Lentinus tigrinus ALCF2SS1-6 TaxID=1328759 RepID=A0A5C2RMP1_9APHY|nr:hypothetical protein L227DRAFT_617874 [Lentinus tigrinus ALCF2SS1-6]
MPMTASFLTPHDKVFRQPRLNREHHPQSHGRMTSWQAFSAFLNDVHIWTLVSFDVRVTTISYFLPTLINRVSFSPVASTFEGLTVVPYAAAWFMVVSPIISFVLAVRKLTELATQRCFDCKLKYLYFLLLSII